MEKQSFSEFHLFYATHDSITFKPIYQGRISRRSNPRKLNLDNYSDYGVLPDH